MADAYEKASNTSDTTGRRIKRCDVKPPRVVVLSEEDVRIMQSFKEEFDRIGKSSLCLRIRLTLFVLVYYCVILIALISEAFVGSNQQWYFLNLFCQGIEFIWKEEGGGCMF